MARTLQFSFEELPLVIESGFEAADIAGCAEISYHRDGEWSIRAIALDGARRLSHTAQDVLAAQREAKPLPRFERKPIPLDEGDPIYMRIYHRLEHEWRGRVHDAVIDRLALDRETYPDNLADHRRALQAAE